MHEQMVFTCTIYDMCKQQDCLSPNCTNPTANEYLISPARNGSGFEVVFVDEEIGGYFYVKPDEVFYMTDDYKYVKVVDNTFETTMTVKSFTPTPLNTGYYDLVIEYRFDYALEFFDEDNNAKAAYIQNTPVYQIQAYSTYTKTVQLYGGEIQNTVTTLSSFSGQCCSKYPEYNIQTTADIIKAENLPIQELICNPYVDQSKNELDEDVIYTPSITIGLFTIISLLRPNRINILTGKPIDIPTCNNQINICEDFNSIPFPYEAFDASGGHPCK